jgi:hypothetical protein
MAQQSSRQPTEAQRIPANSANTGENTVANASLLSRLHVEYSLKRGRQTWGNRGDQQVTLGSGQR